MFQRKGDERDMMPKCKVQIWTEPVPGKSIAVKASLRQLAKLGYGLWFM